MTKNNTRRDLLLSALVPGLLLLAGLLTVRFSYEINDDTTMISMLNGAFSGTPSPYCVFIKFPLSFLISLLYSTGIPISWYQVTMFAILWFAMANLLFRLLKRLPERPVLASSLLAGSVSALWMLNIMRFTFSTCGAFLAASALVAFALQTREEDRKPGYLISLVALYVFAYLLRDYFCYVATCFLAVIWFFKYGREMFRNRTCWRIPVAALLSMAIAMGINTAAYQVGDWDWYIDYNNTRSNLQDIVGFPAYKHHWEFINDLGYDEREYYAISHYDYGLLEDYDPNDLTPLNDYANSLEEDKGLVRTVKDAIKQAIDYYIVDGPEHLTPQVLLSYLLPAALLLFTLWEGLRKKEWWTLFCNFIILAGMAGIWLVIGWQGRYPTRVASTMRILTIGASLAGLLLPLVGRQTEAGQRENRLEGRPPYERLLSGALAGLFLVFALFGLISAREERGAPREAVSMEYVAYAAQHPENIYIRDTRSTQNNTSLLAEYPKSPVNLVVTGSWTAYSPLYYEKLASLGLEELNRETLFRENCYLVVSEDYSLCKILGVNDDAEIVYDVVEIFEDGIQILKIHSITE